MRTSKIPKDTYPIYSQYHGVIQHTDQFCSLLSSLITCLHKGLCIFKIISAKIIVEWRSIFAKGYIDISTFSFLRFSVFKVIIRPINILYPFIHLYASIFIAFSYFPIQKHSSNTSALIGASMGQATVENRHRRLAVWRPERVLWGCELSRNFRSKSGPYRQVSTSSSWY